MDLGYCPWQDFPRTSSGNGDGQLPATRRLSTLEIFFFFLDCSWSLHCLTCHHQCRQRSRTDSKVMVVRRMYTLTCAIVALASSTLQNVNSGLAFLCLRCSPPTAWLRHGPDVCLVPTPAGCPTWGRHFSGMTHPFDAHRPRADGRNNRGHLADGIDLAILIRWA